MTSITGQHFLVYHKIHYIHKLLFVDLGEVSIIDWAIYLFDVWHDDTTILDRPFNMDPFFDRVSRLVSFDPLRPVSRQGLAEFFVVLKLDLRRPDPVRAISNEFDDPIDQHVYADVSWWRRRRGHKLWSWIILTTEIELVAGQLCGRLLCLSLRVVLRRVRL